MWSGPHEVDMSWNEDFLSKPLENSVLFGLSGMRSDLCGSLAELICVALIVYEVLGMSWTYNWVVTCNVNRPVQDKLIPSELGLLSMLYLKFMEYCQNFGETWTGIARRIGQDEESEALPSHLFVDFLSSGQLMSQWKSCRALGHSRGRKKTNVFARLSKSIVDTLAKHWTTTRGAEILAMAVVSTQLADSSRSIKYFSSFLALSKCREDLGCMKPKCKLEDDWPHIWSLLLLRRELGKLFSRLSWWMFSTVQDTSRRLLLQRC